MIPKPSIHPIPHAQSSSRPTSTHSSHDDGAWLRNRRSSSGRPFAARRRHSGIGSEPGINPTDDKYGHFSEKCAIQVTDFSSEHVLLTTLSNAEFVELLKQKQSPQPDEPNDAPSKRRLRWINVGGISWDVLSALALRYSTTGPSLSSRKLGDNPYAQISTPSRWKTYSMSKDTTSPRRITTTNTCFCGSCAIPFQRKRTAIRDPIRYLSILAALIIADHLREMTWKKWLESRTTLSLNTSRAVLQDSAGFASRSVDILGRNKSSSLINVVIGPATANFAHCGTDKRRQSSRQTRAHVHIPLARR
jgi:hypothetical protein